ncbi:MAG TPA: DUF2207 domain-containing protein [Sphingomicrobium sp.]|nr:DUF2207 domain-containing protein [Sphingomicrobium sp.]
MRLFRAGLAALALFVSVSAAAEERITSYVSDVAIQPDASLEVTETIDIVSEGNQIRHGIYRDFPTRYTGPNGSRVRVGFEFQGAERDGNTEPATVEPLSNGVRMKIGDADVDLPPGEHRYVIRYRTTRQIGRFPEYDELYWNVTGNGWVFPIEVAEARIRLPSPVKFGQRAAYTGPQGSTDSNARVVSDQPGEIVFRTTWPLGPYEGLTVAAAWPKGVVGEPDEKTKLGWWLSDYGPPIIGGLGLLAILSFYYVAWQRAGRDPRAGTIVPLFSPPDDLSPAAMRYVTEMGADNRSFAAALVDMGVRGHIRIVEEDGGWFSGDTRRIERLAGTDPLPTEEQMALGQLLSTGESIEMKQKNHAKFSSAKSSLEEYLKNRFEGKLFKRNYSWASAGLGVFVAAVWLAAATVALATGAASTLEAGLAIAATLIAVMFLVLQDRFKTAGKCLFGALTFLAGFAALALGGQLFFKALSTGWWFPLLLPLLSLPIVISAFWWMSAPTEEGRKVLDRIAGFKRYLSVTERERLDRMTPPEDTPELFERYLPYAIALEVENRWAARFAGVLAAAAVSGQQGFAWYSGSQTPWNDVDGFTRSVGSSLASTVSSASAAPGSSSGSGGGGSSGGGGGGGGGGGW